MGGMHVGQGIRACQRWNAGHRAFLLYNMDSVKVRGMNADKH